MADKVEIVRVMRMTLATKEQRAALLARLRLDHLDSGPPKGRDWAAWERDMDLVLSYVSPEDEMEHEEYLEEDEMLEGYPAPPILEGETLGVGVKPYIQPNNDPEILF